METGNRWSGNASPRDLTKTRQQQLLKEKAAREAAKHVDIAEVQRVAFANGHAAGFEAGFTNGWDALAEHLVAEGILEPDEPGDDSDQDA
jgi:hypothetical protein